MRPNVIYKTTTTTTKQQVKQVCSRWKVVKYTCLQPTCTVLTDSTVYYFFLNGSNDLLVLGIASTYLLELQNYQAKHDVFPILQMSKKWEFLHNTTSESISSLMVIWVKPKSNPSWHFIKQFHHLGPFAFVPSFCKHWHSCAEGFTIEQYHTLIISWPT